LRTKFRSTPSVRAYFIDLNMNSFTRSKTKWSGLALFLLLALLGCRHSAPRAARGAGETGVIAGDPATNVMIVPASAGWKMRGGATNQLPTGVISSQPLPFPEYDQPLVKKIYGRWQDLLNAQPQPAAKGVVVVEFLLHEDGSVSRLRRLPSEVTPRLEQLCERAILETAPFRKWTPEMRTEIGADTRLITIRFDFNALSKSP